MNPTTAQVDTAIKMLAAFAAFEANKRRKDSNYYEYRRLSGLLLELCEGNHALFAAAENAAKQVC